MLIIELKSFEDSSSCLRCILHCNQPSSNVPSLFQISFLEAQTKMIALFFIICLAAFSIESKGKLIAPSKCELSNSDSDLTSATTAPFETSSLKSTIALASWIFFEFQHVKSMFCRRLEVSKGQKATQ